MLRSCGSIPSHGSLLFAIIIIMIIIISTTAEAYKTGIHRHRSHEEGTTPFRRTRTKANLGNSEM